MSTQVNGNFQTFGGIADVLEAENIERLENKEREDGVRGKPMGRSASSANIIGNRLMQPMQQMHLDPVISASSSEDEDEDDEGFLDMQAFQPS